MELIFNDLSIHGQFHDMETFRAAITRVMYLRQIAHQFGRELYCHRNVANAQVTPTSTMQQVVQRTLNRDQTRSLVQWLNHHGPFWEDVRQHGVNDWLEYNGNIVTDTAVGEAAYCLFHGVPRDLVSMDPSCWLTSPLSVDWREAAEHLLSRLDILHRLRNCFDQHGKRTQEGHKIYIDYFTGARAWFSDSADTEKEEFKEALTFSHPETPREFLFCTWHGKVNYRPPLRIHFSWPIQANEPLYVVYVGPKITRR